MARLASITENLQTKMPLLVQTVDGINKKAQKQSGNQLPVAYQFSKLMNREKLATIQDLVIYLNQFDPTEKIAKYTQWIIKIAATGQLNLPEDGERVRQALGIFDTVKNSSKIDINRDINSYTNFRQFETILKQYKTSEDAPASVRQWSEWIKTKGRSDILNDSVFTLQRFDKTGETIQVFPNATGKYQSDWIPAQFAKTPEEKQAVKSFDQAAIAISKLACGTSYCVANPGTATNYLNQGPLFVLYRDGQFYTLADSGWDTFANTDDVMLSRMSPKLAFFLSKAILLHSDKLGSGVETLQMHIDNTIKTYDIANQKALEVMKRAVALPVRAKR